MNHAAASYARRGTGLWGALFLLAACAPAALRVNHAPSSATARPPSSQDSARSPIDLRIVYMIHGDADYLYHDADGTVLQADKEALRQAVDVAEHTPRAEVFIFHQGPATTRMFRSVPGGTFWHYRDGMLLLKQRYSDVSGPGLFTVEAALFQTRVDDFAQPRRVFAYFGHEIPVQPQTGYSVSRPDREYSSARFAEGLSRWARPTDGASKQFDLIVLSTCYGSTPPLLQALLPLTDYVVASPANLHLSHLDTHPFTAFRADDSILENSARKTPVLTDTAIGMLADRVANRSFESLSKKTTTEITVAVYDLEKARPFLTDFQQTVRAVNGPGFVDTTNTELKPRWRDCERDPAFDPEIANRGVRLWFRAPRFGPRKDVTARSAWECQDL